MKNLLHERLRNASVVEHSQFIEIGDKRLFLCGSYCAAIADEIERDYIPRPQYEGWKPLQDVDAEIAAMPVCKLGYERGRQDGYSECDAEIEFNMEDQYKLGYAYAAGNPKEWYVLDKNGKEVHIGDHIMNGNGEIEVVDTLGDGYVYVDEDGYRSENIEKVASSWEELRKDLAWEFAEEYPTDECLAKADKYLDLARELVKA